MAYYNMFGVKAPGVGTPYICHTGMCGLYGWVFYSLKICRNGVSFTEKSVEMGIFFNLYPSIYKKPNRNCYKIAENRQNNQ